MSDVNQIRTGFERLINEEGQRIVFWNDQDHECFITVPILAQNVERRPNPSPVSVMSAGRRT
jgi:hypothetical protein